MAEELFGKFGLKNVLQMQKLTLKYEDLFICMFSLLDIYWEKTKLDDLGGLLGSINLYLFPVIKGSTKHSLFQIMDKSLVKDWEIVTEKKDNISETEGYNYMMLFLEKQLHWLKIELLINDLKKAFQQKNEFWFIWLKLFKEKQGN